MLHIREVYINKTENARFGDSGVYETFTDDIGKLFKSLQREYGRCTGKVWISDEDGTAHQIGWTFEKVMLYEDARNKHDTYLREVWVELHENEPTVKVTNHFHFID